MLDTYQYLKEALPRDHSQQRNSKMILHSYVSKGFNPKKILDVGCGNGRSYDLFMELLPESSWCGVDIEISPEVNSRTRKDANFITYDGEILPFDNGHFDLLYSNQVLEHVRKPDIALQETCRVLKKGGLFIGQTSQFEPYHSYSFWNFTVYGFKKIAEDAGLNIIELRPSIDGFTLMERSYNGKHEKYSKYFSEESPLNKEIDILSNKKNHSHQVINHRKLQMCGQFCFVAVK